MQNSSFTGTRSGLLLTLFILGVVTILVLVPTQFRSEAVSGDGLVIRTTAAEEGLPNYDIRLQSKETAIDEYLSSARQSIGKNAAVVADIRDGFVRGENDLRTRVPDLKVEYNEDIRIPEVLTPDVWQKEIGHLTGPSSTKRSDILRNFVRQNNDLIGVNDEQANALRVAADYTNPNGYMSFAHLEQLINEVPVFRGEIKAGFNKDGQIIRVINNLAPGLEYDSLRSEFGNPTDAVKSAFRYINREPEASDITVNDVASNKLKTVFGGGDWATTAQKMYFPTEPGVAVPSYMVTIWLPVRAYMVIVDAENGQLLWRKNATNDQTQSATYQVYRNVNSFLGAHDSPAPLSPYAPVPVTAPINAQGALLTRSTHTLIGNEAPYTFNNNGWITDGANVTDGNALEAGIDRDGTNGVDAPQTGNPNRTFDSTWNPPPGNPGPGDEPLTAQAQRGAVIQMFYVMNRYHDELYRVGFTEAARNFQASNFGRGGAENDRISAEGQDSAGTNNANFSIVADGTRGRMQMFLWSGPAPDKDGTTDAEVIIHEVTHGTSQRLHGNSTGLSNNMSGGMGEGWGDWYAYTMLAEPTDSIDQGIYTTGGYATHLLGGMTSNYYHGIRRFPRAPITYTGGPNNKPHNPFTFKHLNAGCDAFLGTTAAAVDSAFPRNPSVATSGSCDQVHNAGEVWSSLLWEVRNRMVTRLGFTAGTTRVLQVVTDGMKLAPLNPTFVQERDAIIAAAAALPVAPEAAADVLDVREGFRVRGMGFSASVTTAVPASVVEAFDVPNAIFTNPITVSDSTGDGDGFPEPGEALVVSVPVTNNSGATINDVNANITGGGNASYGNIAHGASVTRNISYTVPGGAACGSVHQITINGTSAVGAMNPRNFSFQLGAPVGGAPVTFESNTLMNIPNGQPTTTSGPAGPYSSDIVVSGLTGGKKIKIELTTNNHTWAGDQDILLEGPGGQKFIIYSDAFDSSNRTGTVTTVMTIRDDAAATMASTGVWPASADFRPTNHATGDTWAAPAPAGPYLSPAPAGSETFASAFGTNGAAMNGTWKLWVVDDAAADTGTMAEWKITFEANDFACNLLAVRSRADFDGDGRSDVSVFRPSDGNWYLNRSTAGFLAFAWGLGTDALVPGDYDNDNKTDTAVYRPVADSSQPDFFILRSNGFVVSGLSWGLPGDIPVVADYDNDGRTDAAVFRPSNNTWYAHRSSDAGVIVVNHGQAGDVPVAGNFGGDATADFTVYRAGTWISQFAGGGSLNTPLGQAGDILVPADYSGDNVDDVAVFRPSTGVWHVRNSTGGAITTTLWGISTDVPTPGDYDGDGKDDFAIYRNGQWWILASTAGISTQPFGAATDKPIARQYLP